MIEDRFDERLRQIAREYNEPPPTPREEMWASIQAARDEEATHRFSPRHRGWIAWGVGIAAVLMVGVGLGRLSVRPADAPPMASASSESIPAPAPGGTGEAGETAYRVAATQHLGRAEVLLTSFRSEARTGDIDSRVGVWAKDLLSTTRLLLDSPAGEDEKLRVLLEDLELVLVQLSQLPPDGSSEEAKQELEMATNAIEQGAMLPKIRTALEGGPTQTNIQEEL